MNRDLIVEVAENNPGALTVLVQLQSDELMQSLKEQGATGADIWLLYKDECGQNLDMVRAIIEAGTVYATLKGNIYFSGYSAEQSNDD